MIRYAAMSIEENEHLYGPGKRLVIWVQGCSIHCDGCINRHLWDFDGGKTITIAEFVSRCSSDDFEGVTLLGGEPLDQPEAILEVIESVHAVGKTVVLFTGYEQSQLLTYANQSAWRKSDIVVCGPYVKALRNPYLQFRGSSNQQVLIHSNKYHNYQLSDNKNVSIIKIKEDGTVVIQGYCELDGIRDKNG